LQQPTVQSRQVKLKTLFHSISIIVAGIILLYPAVVRAQCSSCDITISSSHSSSINVANGKRLCITSNGSVTGTVTLGNNAKICNEGTFSPSSFSASWGASITNSGQLTLPSNYHVTNTFTNSGTATINGNLTSNNGKNIANTSALNITGYLSNEGDLSNSGSIDVTGNYSNKKTFNNSGSISVGGNFTNTSSGGVNAQNSGEIEVTGNFSNQGPFNNKSGGDIDVTGTFTNTSSGSASFTNNDKLTVAGSFTNTNDLTNNGTLSIGGNFENSNSGNAYIDNYGDLTIYGNVNNYQSFDNFGVATIKGDFTQTNVGSAELKNDSTFSVAGDINSNNDIKNTGFITAGGTYTNSKWSGSYESNPNSLLVVDSFVNESNVTSSSSKYGQIQVISYASNTGSVGTYIDVCILSNNGNWNSNTGTVNANVVNCTQTVSSNLVNLNISLFMEACYNNSGDKMETTLRQSKQLPKKQPFKNGRWNWKGSESVNDSVADISGSIVDWVLVEFRTGTAASSSFWKKSFFLTEDGELKDGLGNAALIEKPTETSFYIVVSSRNHLGVMSSSKVSVVGGGISYDFTTTQSKAYTSGADPMIELEPGIFGLVSGDINGDGTINAIDAWQWYSQSGSSGYHQADLNLDNQTNATDKSWWQSRNGRSVQYPTL